MTFYERYLVFYWERLPYFLGGAKVTVQLSLAAIVLALALGLIAALMRMSRSRVLRGVAYTYALVVRGTPLLVQILIIWFWLPQLGIDLGTRFVAAMVALGVNYGAYASEIIRAGLESIDKGQMEAARSLGMSRGMAMRRIIIPQAYRRLIPPLGNEFIAMMKDTSLVSAIGMEELLRRTQHIASGSARGDAFFIAALLYLILTTVFSFLQGRLERRLGVYE